MNSIRTESPVELVRRLTAGELDSLRDSVAAGRAEIGLKALDERGAASDLVRDQYTGRYPLELIQNANDAAASGGATGGRVKFVLSESALLVADEGAGFGTDQVRAICGLARSSKDPRKSIGYKGLGFKSVREITDTPQVISDDLMFCFDADRLRTEVEIILGGALPDGLRLPDYAFPFEMAAEDLGADRGAVEALLAEGFKTIMRLPFRHGEGRQIVEKHLVGTVVPRLLLFLDATECLELSGTPGDFTAVAIRDRHDGYQELLLEAGERTEHFLLFRREVTIVDRTLVAPLGGAWSEVEAIRLVVAVPLGSDGMPAGGATEPLHVYFPTEEQTGVSLILNADFQMELDRRRISRTVQAEAYNLWLRNQLADFVASTVVPTLVKKFDGIGVLDVLASYGHESGWGKEIMEEVVDALDGQRFVPCRDSELRTPSESRLLPSTVPDPAALNRWVEGQSALVTPAAEMSAHVRELLAVRLKVPELSVGTVLASLRPPADQDVVAFYNFLLAWSYRTSRTFAAWLAKARCIRLPGDRWVRPSEGAVFLPPQRAESDFPSELQLPIAQLPEIDGLAKLLEDAGVEPLTWRALVSDFLMPRLTSSDGDEDERDSALKALRTYYERVRRGGAGDQEIREAVRDTLLPARSVNREQVRMVTASQLYFGDAWPRADGLELLFGPFGEPDFLDVEPGNDAASEFEFYRWLGVADSPRVVEVHDWDSAYSGWRWLADYRDASACLAGAHPKSQSLTSKPSLDRLPELLKCGDSTRLGALWRVLAARWADYRPRLMHATWRCIASASHAVDRDRRFVSPALFLLRSVAWVPAEGAGPKSLEKPGDLWRSTQGMPREVSRRLNVPTRNLGRVPADFAEDLGILDIATASSTDWIDLLSDLEAGGGAYEGPTASLGAAEWLLRRLEDSAWPELPIPGSVPLIARLAGQLVFQRHPVIVDNPVLADVWGDTLPIYAGDRNLDRLLRALGIQVLDELVNVEPVIGDRQLELEEETLAHLYDVAPTLIALASRDVPSRRLEIAQRLRELRVVCSSEVLLQYMLEGHEQRIDDGATAYIDRDGVLYLQTDGAEPDWPSLALRLAEYLGVESGDGLAFALTADSRVRNGFLRAHRISGEDLEVAAEAYDAQPSRDDDSDDEWLGDDEPTHDGVTMQRDYSAPDAVGDDDNVGSDGASSQGGLAAAGFSEATVNGGESRESPMTQSQSSTAGKRDPSSTSGGTDSGCVEPDRTHELGPTVGPSSTRRSATAANVEGDVGRFYSYVVARGSREARMAERAESEAMRIGSLGVDRVVAYEAGFGRAAVPQDHSNKGFDIISARPDDSDHRVIEVKATARAWPSRGIPVSKHQIDKNVESGDDFWLYVVEFATDPQLARVIPIQNPIAGVDYFVFDPGWENLAGDAYE
ncbi:sacsin N-terminal ATP-binding-like domain-containing protein [Kocuria sp. CPCC 205300]|uniref:sacsin N-terminal ATP-binding-like domain-containing protein n=1 Tax=Kocuria sabuli TaxID=3071448 RepID=UPI0036DC8DF5